jgi:hypothetical protein
MLVAVAQVQMIMEEPLVLVGLEAVAQEKLTILLEYLELQIQEEVVEVLDIHQPLMV